MSPYSMYHVTRVTSFERSEGVAALHHFVIMNMYAVKPQIELKYQAFKEGEAKSIRLIRVLVKR